MVNFINKYCYLTKPHHEFIHISRIYRKGSGTLKKEILRKDIRSYLEAELKAYHKTKKELEQSIQSNPYLSKEYIIQNFSQNIFLSLNEQKKIQYMEYMVNCIEKIYKKLPENKQKLLQLKYWQKNQSLSDIGIAQILHCDRSTIWRWNMEILIFLAQEIGFPINIETPQKNQNHCQTF